MRRFYFILAIALLILPLQGMRPAPVKTVNDFTLRDVSGKYISLKDYPNAKGFMVVFICNHCPFAKLYINRLNQLNTKYSVLNVPLIAIDPMDSLTFEDETFANMQKRAQEGHFNFPYLSDGSQQAAKAFEARRTPDAFVIWKENNQWTIKYQGAIDDNGSEPDSVKEHYLSNAVDELLANKPVTTSSTISIGCYVHYR